jgi:tetratricopeptide (TPR) repeat protein
MPLAQNINEQIAAAESLPDGKPVSIRVSPSSYFVALLLGSFFSAFCFYLESDAAGVTLFILSWIFVPFFAMNDHVVFDGKRLSRSGIVPNFWAWVYGTRRRLKISDIEQIETQAIRALKRGGNVYYRYRTAVRGKGIQIAFASGGEEYRRMLGVILPRVAENVLDNRSIELRDHLADPKETIMKAEFEHIPSNDFLRHESAKQKRSSAHAPREASSGDGERAEYLRGLGNELRLNGFLPQALESFRRALVIRPQDGRILFEFARCLYSFAGTEHSHRLERKALAAMRLAERRAGDDGELLTRLGEAYFQAGEWRRAGVAFQKAIDQVGVGFRSARGLAEIALREGKIAHVIHHFSTANRLADTAALRRWTRGEAEYFSNLNSDDEYMELEISRVQMLETLERSKQTALRIAVFGFPAIFVGILIEESLIANVGWAVCMIALLVWSGLNVSVRMLSTRVPYEMLETDD